MQRLVIGAEQIAGQTLALSLDQQHYLRRVLRLHGGDRFLALDGQGQIWLATLEQTGETATLSAPPPGTEISAAASKTHLTLTACLPKQGFDEVVRQATELGVDRIVPLLSDRTLLHPSPQKLQRWRRIATEAAEQSERLTVPTLEDPLPWATWMAQETTDLRCLCVARHAVPPLLSLVLSRTLDGIEVAVGPEGGWTDREIEQAIAIGYHPVTLGQGILRAVTASISALSTVQAGLEFVSMVPYQLM